MLADYHMHSHFSRDSKTNLLALCQSAVAAGLDEIAVTDHMDLCYPIRKPNHEFSDFTAYFEAIKEMQQQFASQLTIRAGIEIGMEPHYAKEYPKFLEEYPFDFVIGSIHEVHGEGVSHSEFYHGKSKEDAYRIYYTAFLDCIDAGIDFDVIGHLDYPKRYMPEPYMPGDYLIAEDLIDELFRKLIAKGKGIEINTSGFRHVSNMCMPHYDILAKYYAMGGRRITVGSDSHRAETVGLGVTTVQNKLKEIGFTTISSFEKRKEIPRSIL